MNKPELLVFKLILLTGLFALVFLTSCTKQDTSIRANCVIDMQDKESVIIDKIRECTNNPNIVILKRF